MVSVGDFERFAFVVGAPRCGTTTLAQFLKGHADVAFPLVKEPHFFAQHDLRRLSGTELRSQVEQGYLRRFFRSDAGRRIGADASVTYLYMAEQLEPVLRLWPDSRFVIAVRNPLSMLPSLHRRLIYLGDETIGSFREAWAAVPDRAAGRRIPRGCADPRWLRYDLAARFSTYLERLFAVVGRERCHMVVFDDLSEDPAGEYRQLMSFLGLRPMPCPDLSAQRAGRSVRIRWLQRVLKRPPVALREYLAGEQYQRRICSLDEPAGRHSKRLMSLRKRLLKWNRVARPIEPLPIDLQLQICSQLCDEVDRLGQLLGRDLTHWLRPSDEHPPSPLAQPLFETIGEAPRAAYSH